MSNSCHHDDSPRIFSAVISIFKVVHIYTRLFIPRFAVRSRPTLSRMHRALRAFLETEEIYHLILFLFLRLDFEQSNLGKGRSKFVSSNNCKKKRIIVEESYPFANQICRTIDKSWKEEGCYAGRRREGGKNVTSSWKLAADVARQFLAAASIAWNRISE